MSKSETRVYQKLTQFRRRFRPRLERKRGPMNAVPLVDVTLLLLMFVIMNSTFVLKPAIPLRLPEADFETGTRYDAIVVTVSQAGQFFVDDERVGLQQLEEKLERKLQENPEASLLIEADERVRHTVLVAVYGIARSAGVGEVFLATRVPATRGLVP